VGDAASRSKPIKKARAGRFLDTGSELGCGGEIRRDDDSPIDFSQTLLVLTVQRTELRRKSLGAESASNCVVVCTFSTTKRLHRSGNTKQALGRRDPTVLDERCSSTRFAHIDQLERFSRPPGCEPGDGSSRRGKRAVQAGRGHSGRPSPLPPGGHRGLRRTRR